MSILYLHNFSLTTGKHAMLSRLWSLSIYALNEIDKHPDTIILRTDPLIRTAYLIQSYTQHVLKPHKDKESEHQRYFLKMPYINKDIDLIDLQSILRDKHVFDYIPKYFKNSEARIICYKYKKKLSEI